MPSSTLRSKILRISSRIAAMVFWLLLWHIASLAVGKELLLPSPVTTVKRLAELAVTGPFWQAAGLTLGRILLGFLWGVLFGTAMACAAFFLPGGKNLLSPLVGVIRATPVASFIILTLVWFDTGNIPVFIAALMVLPVVYANVERGLRETDRSLLEMAAVFRFKKGAVLRRIYLPAVRPYFVSACTTGLGLGWKAGVAAEVLCQPKFSIGRELYQSKLYLETADLFAWTAVVVALSFLLEKLLTRGLKRVLAPHRAHPLKKSLTRPAPAAAVPTVSGVSFAYGETPVLEDLTLPLPEKGVVCLFGPSGVGKSTILRLLLGLETAASGGVTVSGASAAFQEDRLLAELTVADNLRAVAGGRDPLLLLKTAGLLEEKDRLPHELSGGQRRRAAFCRALAAPGDLLVLDEPFTGIDRAMREKLYPLVRYEGRERLVLLVTHDAEEALRLSDRVLFLDGRPVRQVRALDVAGPREGDALLARYGGEFAADPGKEA